MTSWNKETPSQSWKWCQSVIFHQPRFLDFPKIRGFPFLRYILGAKIRPVANLLYLEFWKRCRLPSDRSKVSCPRSACFLMKNYPCLVKYGGICTINNPNMNQVTYTILICIWNIWYHCFPIVHCDYDVIMWFVTKDWIHAVSISLWSYALTIFTKMVYYKKTLRAMQPLVQHENPKKYLCFKKKINQ